MILLYEIQKEYREQKCGHQKYYKRGNYATLEVYGVWK